MCRKTSSFFVLASASMSRANMLTRAGLDFRCDAADVDEAVLKQRCRAEGMTTEATAITLAGAKAAAVAARHPGVLVLGADQLLEYEGRWLTKAGNRDEARAVLASLRGGKHRLISGAAVVRDGVTLWQAVDTAMLTMWPFDDALLESYLDLIGDAACSSVGAYQIEGLGIRLFERVEGDHFTILGLPLLPFLTFLRNEAGLVFTT